MARSIQTIKESIASAFMANEVNATSYGFTAGDSFESVFSKVSLESIMFYIYSVAAYTLEFLLDTHKSEINSTLDIKLPHRAKWYRDKVLGFMKYHTLVVDTDYYDTSDMTDSEISAAKVVKYAAAKESSDSSILTIKVAGETNGIRSKLDEDTETELRAYIKEFKDAGVRINLINQVADTFSCELDIYYNAMLLPDTVQDKAHAAILDYIENLTFNGEYSNMSLVDAIQSVEGVEVVEFKWAKSADANSSILQAINGTKTPIAGYMKAGSITLNMKVHGE